MKVAVASRNQRGVHQHLERTSQFLICEVRESGYRLVDTRQNWPLCSTQQD
jgi:predicted Fe-Mo cluster-binding NifX family protein